MQEVEVTTISRKYENIRLKDRSREKYLLASIIEQGIKEPLTCVAQDGCYILLDGFKRLRCCQKLKLGHVPVTVVGNDVAESILQLIRLSNEKTLNILEQAGFVDELKKRFGLSVSEIARQLERSNAWVSVRLGILNEMSELVRQEVFSGRFPLRSYMYTLRQFTRVNKIPVKLTDQFVKAVSGKGLSQRNIEKLAYGYFRGNEQLRKQIDAGNVEWTLKHIADGESSKFNEQSELNREETDLIRDLELCQKYMAKIHSGLLEKKERSEAFEKTAKLLIGGILEKLADFIKEIKEYYDRR
jgi:ParB/RepB/Spo0J family partition protein